MFYKLITLLFFTFFSFSASSDPFTNVIGTINQQQQEVIEEKTEETAELKAEDLFDNEISEEEDIFNEEVVEVIETVDQKKKLH